MSQKPTDDDLVYEHAVRVLFAGWLPDGGGDVNHVAIAEELLRIPRRLRGRVEEMVVRAVAEATDSDHWRAEAERYVDGKYVYPPPEPMDWGSAERSRSSHAA